MPFIFIGQQQWLARTLDFKMMGRVLCRCVTAACQDILTFFSNEKVLAFKEID
jgi:hypothetical protein